MKERATGCREAESECWICVCDGKCEACPGHEVKRPWSFQRERLVRKVEWLGRNWTVQSGEVKANGEKLRMEIVDEIGFC